MVATLLSLGAVTGVTLGFSALHDVLHAYETHIIVFSGLMLCLSFAALKLSEHMDCSAHAGCDHEPCAPKKRSHHILFWAAFVMFWFNLAFYLVDHDVPLVPSHVAARIQIFHDIHTPHDADAHPTAATGAARDVGPDHGHTHSPRAAAATPANSLTPEAPTAAPVASGFVSAPAPAGSATAADGPASSGMAPSDMAPSGPPAPAATPSSMPRSEGQGQ